MLRVKISGVLALLLALTLFVSAVSAHPVLNPVPNGAIDPEGVARLVKDSGGAQVEIESATGAARFVRLQGGQIETLAARLGIRRSAAAQADAFFAAYGSIFGIRDAKAELALAETTTDALGETHLTYRQVYQGVPVFAGTLRVHLDAQNRVKVVNGAFVPGIGLDVTPSLSVAKAEAIAKQKVAGSALTAGGAAGVLDAKAVATTLYVYHDGLIRGVTGASHLVYEVEVSNGYDVREFVYVDAHKGNVVNQITGIYEDRERRVYSGTTATLLWSEDDAYPWAGAANVTDTMEINSLITVTGQTYDLFFNTFGRDSYDDNGITLTTIFADADIAAICPNAHWNGAHIGFCRGVTADDVVAHEMGHAYTEYTDNLIYQWQSGALNEAYSDIWGEVVDQINNFQTDTPNAPRTVGECSVYGGVKPASLYVSAPVSIAGNYVVGSASFNPAALATVSGQVVLVDDGNAANGGSVTDACEALVNGAEVSGAIALVDRGGCDDVIKALNVQEAGAIGMIVVNTTDNVPAMSDIDSDVTILSVILGQTDGVALKAALADNPSVTIDAGGVGTDNSVRWLMGEDTFAAGFSGAIRDMWAPSCFGNPDKVTNTRDYYCQLSDGGGVHSNSGVPNHAFALLVDGGVYNRQTVNGIGLLKAAHIYWRAQSVYQVPDSDFADHATALEQSCADLIGENLTGFDGNPSGEVITQGNCDAVAATAAAVEFRSAVPCDFQTVLEPEAPQVCSDAAELPFYSETFDTAPAGWMISNTGVYTTYTARDWVWAATMPITDQVPVTRTGGFYAFDYRSFGDCRPTSDDQSGVMYLDTPTMTVPSGVVGEHLVLTFDHYIATETGYDGGNVWISVNGAEWQLVDAADFTFNSYNATILPDPNTNPLGGQPGFSGIDQGSFVSSWGQSHVDLSAYAETGDVVQLRFAFGVDGCNGIDGWYLDRVDAYYCATPAADIVVAPSALASEQIDDVKVTLPLTISNASGDASLAWKLLGVGPAWAQASDSGNGILNGFFQNFGGGLYNADDFTLDSDTALNSISVSGFVNRVNLTTSLTIDWYIYPDDGGHPAGQPEDEGVTAAWHYSSTAGGPGVDITADNITLGLEAAGQEITLPRGVYWLVVVPSYPYGPQNWYWNDGVDQGAEGMIIDPNNLFGLGITDWTPQSPLAGFRDLQFSIEGTSACTPPSWFSVSSAGGAVARDSSVALTMDFDSTGLSDGVYTHTLCLASNDPTESLLQAPVTLTVSTVPLASAELVGTVQLPYYSDTIITWTVSLLPLNAVHPYTYTINGGLPLTTMDNTVVFTRTGNPVGMHHIDFAVWNSVMSEPLTRTWPYEIIARPGYTVYLPLVLRQVTP